MRAGLAPLSRVIRARGRAAEDALLQVALPPAAVELAQGPAALGVGDHDERRATGGCRRWGPAGPGAGTPRSARARRGAPGRAAADAPRGGQQLVGGEDGHPPDHATMGTVADDLRTLPEGLPAPDDDGAADGLAGSAVPDLALPSTGGGASRSPACPGRRWSSPSRGPAAPASRCPPRDGTRSPARAAAPPRRAGSATSTPTCAPWGSRSSASRPRARRGRRSSWSGSGCPTRCCRTSGSSWPRRWGLPTFAAGGRVLLRRLTMLLRDGAVERVWYPVFPPDRHAERVLGDLG